VCKRVDVDAVLNRDGLGARSSHRMFQQITLAPLKRLPMKPHNHRLKMSRNARRAVRRNEHVSAAEVNLIGEAQRHGQGMSGFRDFTVVGDDGMDARPLSGGKRDHRVARTNHAAGNLAGKSAKRRVGSNDVLNGKSHRVQGRGGTQWNGFEMFKKRRTLVPRRSRAAADDVIAFERTNGNAEDVRNAQLRSQREKITLQLEENILAVIHQIHLVHGSQHIRNSQQRSDVSVAASLRKQSLGRVDQHDGEIGRGSPGGHVARVLLVAGRISNDEFTARRREIPVGHVNRNALLAFSAQPVGKQ
jgi:hypothetical protein